MLSGSALEALKEFYADRDAKEKELENLKAKKNTGDILSMDTFTENWNESQFWVCPPPNLSHNRAFVANSGSIRKKRLISLLGSSSPSVITIQELLSSQLQVPLFS
jgi:hypothetical protein